MARSRCRLDQTGTCDRWQHCQRGVRVTDISRRSRGDAGPRDVGQPVSHGVHRRRIRPARRRSGLHPRPPGAVRNSVSASSVRPDRRALRGRRSRRAYRQRDVAESAARLDRCGPRVHVGSRAMWPALSSGSASPTSEP
jgi:hypothetical protein